MSPIVHNHGAFRALLEAPVAYDKGSNKVAPNQRELTGAYDHPQLKAK